MPDWVSAPGFCAVWLLPRSLQAGTTSGARNIGQRKATFRCLCSASALVRPPPVSPRAQYCSWCGDRYQPPPVLAHRAQLSRHASTGSDLKLGGEKIAQRGRCFDRRLIGQVVSRRDRLCANNIGCVSPPDLGRAGLAAAADAAVRAPQEEHGTFDLAPGFKIPGIHFKIDPCCCTIVLADRVNGRRITEAPLVFCQGFRIEKAQTLFGFCELLFDEPVGISAH